MTIFSTIRSQFGGNDRNENDDTDDRSRPDLPVNQDDPLGNPSDPDSEFDEHDITSIGWFIPPNSLADEIRPYRKEVEERFGYDIALTRVPDENWGGNPYQVQDAARQWEDSLEQQMGWLAKRADYALVPCSLGGSGYLVYKLAEVDDALPTAVEVITPSHEVKQASDPENYARKTINQVAAFARLETGSILIDHRIDSVGFVNVAPEDAQLMGTLGMVDLADLQHTYNTIYYETIPVLESGGSLSGSELTKKVKKAKNTAEPWFTPSEWAPWVDQDDPPVAGAPHVNLIVPEGLDVSGYEMDFQVHKADVVNAHLVGIVPLDREWIERRLMYEGIQWLDEQLTGKQNRYYTVLRELAGEYGVRDPLEKWRTFRNTHLRPQVHLDDIDVDRDSWKEE